jgi:transposase
MAIEQLALIWESEIVRDGEGRVRLVAKQPVKDLSCKQAAKILGLSVWTVQNLYQLGLLEGYKPGARVKRKDGRGSNAALRLDAGSVAAYDARQKAAARAERDG